MKRKVHTIRLWSIFVSLLIFAMTSTICTAEEWSRKGKREVFAIGQYMRGDTTTSLGITLELDDMFAGGIGAGYNYNDHINLNFDLLFTSTDVTAKGFGSTLEGDSTLIGWDVNLDINILKSRITPMITGGIGFIRFDGEYETGTPFEETDFSYNVGGGVRCDVTDHFLIKAIYRATWTKMEDTDEAILLDGITLNVGYIF